jgi:integrase
MRGVTSVKRGKKTYWFAHVDGKKNYCGEGKDGRDVAIAKKAKEIQNKKITKLTGMGIEVEGSEFGTFKELIDWYMKQPSIKNLKNYPQKEVAVEHLKKYFGDKTLKSISVDDQEQYRMHQLEQGLSDGYVNNHIALMSAAYNLALKRKKIPPTLMLGQFLKVEHNNPRRMVEDDEYQALLKVADPDFADVLICGYETGMRAREIRRLTRSQAHLGIKHISGNVMNYFYLGVFDTKNKTERIVPISDTLLPVVKRRLEGLKDEQQIFTYDGQPYTKAKIKNLLRATCKKADVVYGDKPKDAKGNRLGIVFHCFRHTRISLWVKAGYSDQHIRMASGHKDMESYRRYVHLEAADVMNLVQNRTYPVHKIRKSFSSKAL